MLPIMQADPFIGCGGHTLFWSPAHPSPDKQSPQMVSEDPLAGWPPPPEAPSSSDMFLLTVSREKPICIREGLGVGRELGSHKGGGGL